MFQQRTTEKCLSELMFQQRTTEKRLSELSNNTMAMTIF